jgi:chromate transporter
MNREISPLPSASIAPKHPTFGEALRFWIELGFISFGGPTGQIAIMHQELVERRRWIDEEHFLHGLNFCMLLPGPEAQQLATYIGWLLHRTWGGIAAGVLFVLPSAFILWGLSYIYMAFGNVPAIAAVFYGLKPAVMAIVASAVLRIGSKALKNEVMWTVAALAFVAIYFFQAPFPVIVAAAGLLGWIGSRVNRAKFVVIKGRESKKTGNKDREGSAEPAFLALPVHTSPSWSRAGRVLALGLALWWTPVLLAGAWQGWQGTLFRQGLFFSKAAMVTFGGAYAVLPYVSQQAVESYGWLAPGQMLDGLGLAETTPGPLIMVLQFVGFVGGWNHPGGLPPLLAATLGAAMTTWTTFAPCFLWIFLGAPHLEQLRRQERLSAALSTITAAVVGVVLNLAVWFALHVLVPESGIFDGFAAVLAVLAFAAMHRFKWGIVPVIAASALAGLVYRLLLVS